MFCPCSAHHWVFKYTTYDGGRADHYKCQWCNAWQSYTYTTTTAAGTTIEIK